MSILDILSLWGGSLGRQVDKKLDTIEDRPKFETQLFNKELCNPGAIS